jgi:hypothetical protein
MARKKRAIGRLVTPHKVIACMLENPQGECCQTKKTAQGDITMCGKRERTQDRMQFAEGVTVEVKTRTPEYGGLGQKWKRKVDSPQAAVTAIEDIFPEALRASNLIGHREWLYRKYGSGQMPQPVLDAVERIEERTGRSSIFADMSYADIKFWDKKIGRLMRKHGGR